MRWNSTQIVSLVLPTYIKLSIILVPGIGTIPPNKWPFANEDWLATLPSSVSGARILAYEYTSELSWESIMMLGYDFLQRLVDTRSKLDTHLVSSWAWALPVLNIW